MEICTDDNRLIFGALNMEKSKYSALFMMDSHIFGGSLSGILMMDRLIFCGVFVEYYGRMAPQMCDVVDEEKWKYTAIFGGFMLEIY